jgi:hypothetical protein
MFHKLLAALTALLLTVGGGLFASDDARVGARAVDSIGLTVANLERSKRFFQ